MNRDELEGGEIQAIYFMEPRWTPAFGRAWLKDHDFKPIKPLHRKGHELRYRIRDPAAYSRYITKKTDGGIYFVIGFKQ